MLFLCNIRFYFCILHKKLRIWDIDTISVEFVGKSMGGNNKEKLTGDVLWMRLLPESKIRYNYDAIGNYCTFSRVNTTIHQTCELKVEGLVDL